MATDLIYMREMDRLSATATVVDIAEEGGRTIVILDQTVFYPQGGGQPYDKGIIKSDNSTFQVEEVRFVDGVVKHIGTSLSGSLGKGDAVICDVDAERRLLMSRLHSAGHVIDMSIGELGYGWMPGKGFHFPDGPYVEYAGELSPDKLEEARGAIEQKANELIGQEIATTIKFMTKEEMTAVCRHVPEYLPAGKPARVVFYGDYAVPCGGTHVSNLSQIKKLTVRKVKLEKGNIRVAYSVE